MTRRQQIKKIDFNDVYVPTQTMAIAILKINELIDAHNALLALDEPREEKEYCACGKDQRQTTVHSRDGNYCSACGKDIPLPSTPEVKEVREDWEDSILGSVRMLCAYNFHKDMAKTAQRAKEQGGLFEDEYKRLIYKIRSLLLTAKQEGAERRISAYV